MGRNGREVGKTSEYCGVCKVSGGKGKSCKIRWNARHTWQAGLRVNGHNLRKQFETEREAAIQYDKWVLEYRLERPLNILKPKIAS